MTDPAKIAARDISFVVQGPVDTETTARCLASIRAHFPEAELVLSTYHDAALAGLPCDKVVQSADPGGFPYSTKPGAKTNNINRQLVTTLAGLQAVSRPYAFKIRTDFVLTGDGFLDFFGRFPGCDSRYQVFERKLLACSYFTRNPRQKRSGFPYHPSDIAFFGRTLDLVKLFDIPLMPEAETRYYERRGHLHNRYRPEQYLWLNCLRQNGKKINCEHMFDCDINDCETVERYFASNFIFLNWRQFCLSPPAKLLSHVYNDYTTCITHVEWLKLRQKYVDASQAVPDKDFDRLGIARQKRRADVCDFFAGLLVAPLVGKSRRRRRRQLRQAITDKLVARFCRDEA